MFQRPYQYLRCLAVLLLALLFVWYAWGAAGKVLSRRTAVTSKETPVETLGFPTIAFLAPESGNPREWIVTARHYLQVNKTYG